MAFALEPGVVLESPPPTAARREFEQDPADAAVRPASVVERYEPLAGRAAFSMTFSAPAVAACPNVS